MQQSAFEHAALIWTQPANTIHGVIAAVALRWRTRSSIMASLRNCREENDHDLLCWFGRFTERDFDLRR